MNLKKHEQEYDESNIPLESRITILETLIDGLADSCVTLFRRIEKLEKMVGCE